MFSSRLIDSEINIGEGLTNQKRKKKEKTMRGKISFHVRLNALRL